MNAKNTKRIEKLLKPLFLEMEQERVPADEETIGNFRTEAEERGVPKEVIDQLAEYYRVSEGEEELDGYCMHACDDAVLYEWWEDDHELWLGGRDDDVYRWSGGKFCIGDASNVSYGEEYEFPTLVELIEKIVEEIREEWDEDDDEEDDRD